MFQLLTDQKVQYVFYQEETSNVLNVMIRVHNVMKTQPVIGPLVMMTLDSLSIF